MIRRLQSWWWNRIHPNWDLEPDEDTVTPAAMRQWVAGLRHPKACDSGCQCKWSGGDSE